ncbi:MAG: hypothetical protein H7Z41_06085 [Cytophagales bacterium]|nr:hypothetical protein [Armatimonadota bacterium]
MNKTTLKSLGAASGVLAALLGVTSTSAQILSATDKATARLALEAGRSKNLVKERLPIFGSFRSASVVRNDTLKPGQVRDYTASFTRGDAVNIEVRTSSSAICFAVLAPSSDFPLFAGDVAGGRRAYRGIANRTSDYTIRLFLRSDVPKPEKEQAKESGAKKDKDSKEAEKEARYVLSVSRQ